MKKVLKEEVMEQAKYFCDKHPERECFSRLETISWYGSIYDMDVIELHICDECLLEIYKLLEEKFGVKPKELQL